MPFVAAFAIAARGLGLRARAAFVLRTTAGLRATTLLRARRPAVSLRALRLGGTLRTALVSLLRKTPLLVRRIERGRCR